MEIVEETYDNMAHTLNTSNSYDETAKSINKALMSLLHFINEEIPLNNYIVYNILLVAKLFIKDNERKCYCLQSFKNMKLLLNLLDPSGNILENAPKR